MINFKEDKKSLDNRINIHSKFGQKDMVKWVSDFIKPKNKKKNIKILDLACGDGAQTLKLNNYIKKNKLKCKIIGTD